MRRYDECPASHGASSLRYGERTTAGMFSLVCPAATVKIGLGGMVPRTGKCARTNNVVRRRMSPTTVKQTPVSCVNGSAAERCSRQCSKRNPGLW